MPIDDSGKILVTGADGFIGSHLVQRLVELNCDVRALTYYNSFNSWGWLDTLDGAQMQKVEVFPGDLRDSNCMREAVRGCAVVFHLAALIAIPYSYKAPDSYVDTNVKGTLNVLQAARDFEVSKVVVTSTSEVYGTAQRVPIDEDHPLQAQSPYAATKIAADQLALSFYRSFGTPVAVIRPFNTYGPRQSLRAVIPTIISQLAAGATQLRLGALEPTRDFNYVADTVDAFVKVAESGDSIGQVLNAGSGREVSIGGTVELIARLMNVPIEIQTEEQRLRPAQSEVFRLLADSRRIEEATGWKARHTLEQGIEKTIAWFTDGDNLRHYSKINIYNV